MKVLIILAVVAGAFSMPAIPDSELPEPQVIDMHLNEDKIEEVPFVEPTAEELNLPEPVAPEGMPEPVFFDIEYNQEDYYDPKVHLIEEEQQDSQPEFRWNPVRDQEGRVHLFDANPVEMEPEPSFNAMTDTVFILFTRRNPTAGQIINFNMNSVRNSNFASAQPVRFIIHGWNSDRNTAMNRFMRDDFLALANHNVIVVDWGAGANHPNYATSRGRVGDVGAAVARMSDELVGAGLSAYNRINLVGHSLGGHVAGHAGKRATRGRYAALFATDPAGPLFNINQPNDRLAAGDAVYTEALHTNAGVLGFDQPITTASFYPNWGTTQPGCGVDATGACAHERSNLFYSESIRSNRFVARRCTGYAQIQNRNCPGTGSGIMGTDSAKNINGVFFLETNASSPFARG